MSDLREVVNRTIGFLNGQAERWERIHQALGDSVAPCAEACRDFADALDAALYADAEPEIDRCPVCSEPCHATEGDGEGRHLGCQGVER